MYIVYFTVTLKFVSFRRLFIAAYGDEGIEQGSSLLDIINGIQGCNTCLNPYFVVHHFLLDLLAVVYNL